jgi:DNA-binding transcriptional LysR family regulator
MNLHQLELFSAVVERGSFKQASVELFITASALSIQVKRLERDLGVALLRRVPGGVAPTEAGQELYTLARAMLDLRATADRRMADVRHGLAGTVRIGAMRGGPLYYLSEVLRDFLPAHPGARVTVQVEDQDVFLDAMERGNLDLGLDWSPVRRAGIVVTTLLEEPWLVVAAPHHPLASLSTVPRDQVAATPLLALQFRPHFVSPIEIALAEAGIRPPVAMRLPSIDAIVRLAEAGLGIAALARMGVERELAAGRLVALPVEGLALTRQLLLFRPSRPPQSALVARFERFLCAHPRIRGTAGE